MSDQDSVLVEFVCGRSIHFHDFLEEFRLNRPISSVPGIGWSTGAMVQLTNERKFKGFLIEAHRSYDVERFDAAVVIAKMQDLL